MARRKPEPAPAAPPEVPRTEGSSYTVLARRYRPQLFTELVGQEHVAQALINALQTGRVAHAYLFTGARGVGKTSTARILAKCLNCEKGPTAEPCNVCDICRSIIAGEDLDVLEIDGASNRGINEVREIRGNVQYRPSRSRFKIYIIDEVHMLTKEAFNALLKTLEEPPPHVKFIFATTEANKIPITILSRCQRFDFAGISVPRIVQQLRTIVEREGWQADDEALELVARRAGGSMRDAQSLLDQLLAFCPQVGGRLTADLVHQQLGTARDERVLALVEAVLQKNAGEVLRLLTKASDDGLDLGELLDQLIEYWRDLMVVSSAGLEGQSVSVSSVHRETLLRQAQALSLDAILAGLDVLVSARTRLQRGSGHLRVLLEMSLVRLTRLGELVSVGQLAQWLRQPPASASRPTVSSAPASRLVASLTSGEAKKKSVNDSGGSESLANPLAPAASSSAARPGEPQQLTPETLPEVWKSLLQAVGLATGIDLKVAQPAISGPNILAIRFASRYNNQRTRCQHPAQLTRIEEVLQRIAGANWRVRVESLTTAATASAESALSPAAENSVVRARRQQEGLSQKIPLLRTAFEVLEARISRMDEGFGALPDIPGRLESEKE